MMMALGMVEVIGLPPAIEAADAALKAANVSLLSIAKADAGILTVEITGDVDAVSAAVDAGAKAAEQVGTLRTKHVIPRVDDMLKGTVITHKTALFVANDKRTETLLNTIEPTIGAVSVTPDSMPEMEPHMPYDTPEIVPPNVPEVPERSESSPETKPKPAPEKTTEPEVEPISASLPVYRAAELKKKSNDFLRQLLEQHGVQLSSFGEDMKKQDLISLILKEQNKE